MSTLKEKISNDFMIAFKKKQKEKKNFLGLIKSQINTEEKNIGKPVSDSEVVKILKKFEKSLLSIKEANLTKDVQPEDWSEDRELEIVQSYLPKQMTESEIDSKLEEVISSGADNIGKIMGAFKGLEVDMRLVKDKAVEKLNS